MPHPNLPRRRRLLPPLANLAAGLALALLAVQAAASPPAANSAGRSFGTAARDSIDAAASRVVAGAQDVAIYALSLVGVVYRYGGSTPDQGLDCSGLIHYVFQEATGVTLPRTARELARIGDRVPRSELAPGDLVFFNTRHAAFSHVGIYLGDGRFIHAPSTGHRIGVALLSSSYWKKRFDGARRLIGAIPSLMPQAATSAQAAELPAATASLPAAPANPTPDSVAIPGDDQP